MDDILKLAKDYSKKRHLDLLPRGNDNILEKLDYIYDENWENQTFSLFVVKAERCCAGGHQLHQNQRSEQAEALIVEQFIPKI